MKNEQNNFFIPQNAKTQGVPPFNIAFELPDHP